MALPEAVDNETQEFIRREHELHIGGEWTPSAGAVRFETYDPGTGELLGTVAEAAPGDVDAAVQAAAEALPAWRDLPGAERGRLLWALAALMEQHASELGLLESLDNGKPLSLSTGFDVPVSAATFRYYAGWAGKLDARTVEPASPQSGRHVIRILREPLGVVAAIVPWNMPIMLASWKLAPALACGNTVVLKPAEQTSLSALRLAELATEAGLPAGVLNVVTGPGATTGAALARHPGVAKVSFTGSTEVGREILGGSTADFKRVSLELGGKNATIVFADAAEADLKRTASAAAWAVFANAGQICAAGSRLLVESSAYEQVVEAVAGVAEKIRLGHCLDPDARIGPLISEDQLERVRGFVEDGRGEAELIAGGDATGERGYFWQPTVFGEVPRPSPLWTEEVFGPVLCAVPFSDVDEAAALANDSRYGLAAGIFTRDQGRAEALAARLEAGTVWINTYNLIDPAVPWGGGKDSGGGRDNGADALEQYTQQKVLWSRVG